jgi:hypothetical protein
MPATEIREAIGLDLWEQYFSFTIERNPWDRIVSDYFYAAAQVDTIEDFSVWLRKRSIDFLSNWHLYASAGEGIIVKKVIQYPVLAQELNAVVEQCSGQPVLRSALLPRAKGQLRPDWTRDLSTFYGREDTEYVANVCSREIAAFGYEPPE